MAEEEHDRLVAAVRAQGFILQGVVAMALKTLPDPAGMARELKALIGDKFADAPGNAESWMPLERQARLNHLSAHFAEEFWERVAETLEKTS